MYFGGNWTALLFDSPLGRGMMGCSMTLQLLVVTSILFQSSDSLTSREVGHLIKNLLVHWVAYQGQ